MVLSASSVASLTNYGSPWYFFDRQLMWTRARRRSRSWSRCASTTGAGARLVPPLLIVSVGAARRRARPRRRHLRVGVAPLARLRHRSASSPASSPSSRCSLFAADLVTPARRRARTTGARVVRAGPRSCSRCFAALVMQRARPRLDDGARHRRRSRCSSPAASPAASPGGGVRPRASARHAVLAIAEPYRRTRMLTFLDPFADADEHRLPGLAVAHRARQRRLDRRRARRRPGEVELPPERAHRLHLRHHRRGARASSGAASCMRAVRRVRRARHPRRAARARPLRRAARRGHHRVDRRARRSSTSARSSACCRSPASRCRSCRSAARRWSSRWSRPASS